MHESYQDKLVKAKEWLGERCIAHKDYKPQPHHSVILVNGKFKANHVTWKGNSS